MVTCALILILVGLVSVAIFSYSFYQKVSLNNLNKEVSDKTAAWQALQGLATDVKNINGKDQIVVATTKKYSDFQKNLNRIRDLLPEGVVLDSLTINNEGKAVITGTSADAAVVYQFHEVLKEQEDVVNPVLDSLSKTGEDYNFNISLNLVSK